MNFLLQAQTGKTNFVRRGLPYMTSAVGGGSPKSRQKNRGCVNYLRDKGGSGRGFKNQKILRTSYMEAPYINILSLLLAQFPFRLDVNSPPKLLESAICGETKAAASFELQQRERPLTFAPPSLLPLPLPGSRETPSRFPENDFPVQPPPPPPTTSSAVGSSSAAAAAGFMVAKPRMRICFDPETEIPRLQQWFAENNHPSRQQVRYLLSLP